MSYQMVKIPLIIAVSLGLSIGFSARQGFASEAKEEKSEKKEGGKEGEKEGGKEGEKGEKKEPKSAEDSYSTVLNRVLALQAKVHSGKEELEKLIQEKQETKEPARLNEIIKEILRINKELEANVKEYDQQRNVLKYRYPERAKSEKREYERIEVKSLEEMEGQMSLRTSIKGTLNKVRVQYDTAEQKARREFEEAEEKSNKSHGKSKRPSITDTLLIKK